MGKHKVLLAVAALVFALTGTALAEVDLSNGTAGTTVTSGSLGSVDLYNTSPVVFVAFIHNIANLSTPAGAGKFQFRLQRSADPANAVVVEWDSTANGQPYATYNIGYMLPGQTTLTIPEGGANVAQAVQPNFSTDTDQYAVSFTYMPAGSATSRISGGTMSAIGTTGRGWPRAAGSRRSWPMPASGG